jgi:aryl-alcohol dehydrogenase-like predicted oxidoreductase
MKYRSFGKTGITVSEVGIGGDSLSGQTTYGYVDEADGEAAIRRAVELGVTFFDTAETYCDGRSEEVIGRVVGNNPDMVVCTKVGGSAGAITPERIRPAAEASLKRLQRDHIDIYLLHNPTTEQVSDPAVLEAIQALQRDGLIRSYGVATLSAKQFEQTVATLEEGEYSSVQVTMNIAEQKAEQELVPRAAALGVGTIIRVPLGSGVLSGKYTRETQFADDDRRSRGKVREEVAKQMEGRFSAADALRTLAQKEGISMSNAALAWVLNHHDISVAIPGCKNPWQVEDNVAASGIMLSQDFIDGIRAFSGRQDL